MMFRQVFRVENCTVGALLAALRINCVVVIEVEDTALCSPVCWWWRANHVLLDVGKKERISVGAIDRIIQVLNQNRVIAIEIIFHVDHVHLITRCQLFLKVRIVGSGDSKLLHV